MNYYYCKECKEIIEENDIVKGMTYAVDNYRNDECPCGSEDLIEIEDREICPVCWTYHDEDDYTELEQCFKDIYTDSRGTLYMLNYWTQEKMVDTMAELSDSDSTDTTQMTLWADLCENGNIKEFLRFVCKFDDEKADIWRNQKFLQSIEEKQRKNMAERSGMYELIDTGKKGA